MAKRVMIVDDDANIRRILRTMLSGYYTVSEFENGQIAYENLQREIESGLTLVLTDILMPVMGGIELAKKIKERYPTMPILAITGNENNIQEKDRDSFKEVIIKPLKFSNLTQTLNKYV
jgi:two-component system response regulator YesN